MFIAHLPAGYLFTRTFFSKQRSAGLWIGLFFSLVPDFDLLWFYLVSARRIPHHQYFTHWPLFWLAVFGLAAAMAFWLKKPHWRMFLVIAFANIYLHLALDSFAAEILWFAPFSYTAFNWVDVPAVYDWWVWNFILHWTFAVEIAICLTACAVLYISSRKIRCREHS